jgi:hypothetical protein
MTLRTLFVIFLCFGFAGTATAGDWNDLEDQPQVAQSDGEFEFEDMEDMESGSESGSDSDGEPEFQDFEEMESESGSDEDIQFEDMGAPAEGGEGEAASGEFEAIGLPRITGFFRSSEVLAGPLAEQLTAVLNEKIGELAEYERVDYSAIYEEFDVMGEQLANECAFDPVCLGRLGRQNNIDYIIVGRVEAGEDPGTWATTLNVVDAVNGTIDNFVYFTTDDRTVSVQNRIDAQVNRLLRIRTFEEDGGIDRGSTRAQKIVGWTAVGLGVAAIGTGAYFGIDFAQQKNDLEDCQIVDGLQEPLTNADVCAITQQDANQQIEDMRPSRNLSLALTGAGAGLVVTGTVLLLINSGQDIYEERGDTASRSTRFQVSPTFTRGGFGISSNFEF